LNENDLMAGPDNPGKNYYVSKQYYRYIRPGAQMVDAKSSDSNVLAVAFDNTQIGAFTIVAINTGTAATPLTLAGSNLPSSYEAIRTSASENAVDLGTVTAGDITLPPSSITTLVSGNYLESQAPATDAGADSGSGGNSGSDGATGSGGAAGSGGAIGGGGVPSSGGATGGAAGSRGSTTSAGSSGCSYDANGGTSSSDSRAIFAFAGLVALGLLRRRRK
jgi:MYXO-CTERM domain-containing protein